MTISSSIREIVRSTYNYQCGYYGITETLAGGKLEIDHYCPTRHGGLDTVDNLIYACTTCNRFKGDYWPEEDAPQNFRLLRPLVDDLDEYISETVDGHLIGLTPRGWFHINWLHLNRPQLVELRHLIRAENALRDTLRQTLETNIRLQRQIRTLETEIAVLRGQIAQLSEDG